MPRNQEDQNNPDTIVVPLTPELRAKLRYLDEFHRFRDETSGYYGHSLSVEMGVSDITESLGEALYDAFKGRTLIEHDRG